MGILYAASSSQPSPQATTEPPARELPTHRLQKSQSRRVALSDDGTSYIPSRAHSPTLLTDRRGSCLSPQIQAQFCVAGGMQNARKGCDWSATSRKNRLLDCLMTLEDGERWLRITASTPRPASCRAAPARARP